MPRMRGTILVLLALSCTLLIMSCGDRAPKDVSVDNLPKQVAWIHSWIGKGNISARTNWLLQLTDDRKAYVVEGETTYSYSLDKKNAEGVLSVADVRHLLETIRKARWKRSEKPGEQILSNDKEFTNRILTFTLPGEADSFRLASTSNTPDGAPWNLYLGQKVFVTEDPALGAEVVHLYETLQSTAASQK